MSRISQACLVVCLSAVFAVMAAAQSSSFGSGTHVVGTDIVPGLYRTEGVVTYFERLSGLSGEFGDIISNEASPEGPVLIEIKDTDVAFHCEGSATWTLVDESYQPLPVTTFAAGWWLVGRDIQPGLYRTEGEVSYLARLSGLGGELSDILANEALTDGPVVVEIKEDDVAFQTQGSGTWQLIDESYAPTPRSSFGDGWWIVGVDILPGVYRTPDDVGYYARLSGFGHQLSDIITNAVSEEGAIIEIQLTDVGFETSGGATWSLQGTTPTNLSVITWGEVKTMARR